MEGACPGPLFALIGNGILVMAVALVSAVADTWACVAPRPRLPHWLSVRFATLRVAAWPGLPTCFEA